MSEIDSLTVSVIWGRLVSIAEEMGVTVRRTAYSEAVREGGDFSVAVFDAEGQMLSQADLSPGHLGAMPFAIGNMLKSYPRETLKSGDIIIMNDLYMGSGHLPDFYCMSPVFLQSQIVGFVVASAHMVDVGGIKAGSQAVEGVTERFQEGICFPPVKFYNAGVPVPEITRIIEANVRVPSKVIGDLKALRNALHAGGRALSSLFATYGVERLTAAARRILDQSERAVRESLSEIPDGDYSYEDWLDDVGPGTRPVKLAVTVRVRGSEIIFDFSDSDPQTASAINSPINFTRAYCYWATKAITTRNDIPQNHGQLRPVTLVVPDSNFFNPSPPAAAGGRAMLNQRIPELIFGALAQIVPERITAGSGQWANPIINGIDPRNGQRFVFYDYLVGGVGARSGADGTSALSPVFSLENIPVEMQEAACPILVEAFGFLRDSGGAGEYRGGLSLYKEVRILAEHAEVSNLSDRHSHGSYGLEGGLDGPVGRSVLNPHSDEPVVMHSKGVYALKKGDVLRYECSGSGGFGDPKQRRREAVEDDLREGRISSEAAATIYGLESP
ncbi:hydantoinase B/oxoprolinase family protein [Mesorhizobium sp. YM1C-6-2]|uniref:hydantoinase B/oxoprolinase family protein n=1 Tax=Mesorhizobium sp. YM1C-6-2 TaxID=1827501 RepID=UPI000EF18889|nr:hydantoinase B/oxoprolinase family protein [Mesorhizobium sp. YM1C-6-2]RLP24041.1 hydantoinase B/oxoprolinase family protein [Mesorhizobium sp. YM1C-6-2]